MKHNVKGEELTAKRAKQCREQREKRERAVSGAAFHTRRHRHRLDNALSKQIK